MTICFVRSIYSLLYLSNRGDTLRETALIILTIVGVTIFGVLFVMAFAIFNFPLPQDQLPWACIKGHFLYFKEFLKILLIVQEIFVPKFENQYFIHCIYYVLLVMILGALALKKSIYYDIHVNKIETHSLLMTFAFSIVCLFKLFFTIQILQIMIFYPIVAYTVFKVNEILEERRRTKFLKGFEDKQLPSTQLLIEAIQYFLIIINRQSEDDLSVLQRLQYMHRLKCVRDECICNHYHYFVVKQFIAKSEREQLRQEMQRQRDEDEDSYSEIPSNATNHLEQTQKDKAPNNQNFTNVQHNPRQRKNTLNSARKKKTESPRRKEERTQLPINDAIDVNTRKFEHKKPSDNELTSFENIYQQQSMGVSCIIKEIDVTDLFKETIQHEKISNQHFDFTQLEASNQEKSLDNLNLKIQKDARKYFYIWLLESIFKEFETSLQSIFAIKNLEFQLLYIYFINKYLQRHYLAVFQLLRISKQSSSDGILDQITFGVCEQMLLQDTFVHFKSQIGGFDITKFIDENHQLLKVDKLYERTTADIIQFWRFWASEEPSLSLVLDLGRTISQNVGKIKTITKSLEGGSYIRKDLSKYQLYALFHLEMLSDPLASNQMQNVLKNTLLYKQKNKFYDDLNKSKNELEQQMPSQINEQGICIVKAWVDTRTQWEFIYGNKGFCDMLGCKETQVPGQNINIMMPQIIASNHKDFIKRFYQSGHPRLLGKLRVLFIRDYKGFLLPITFKLNFYHHPKFSYAFIAMCEKVKYMNLFLEDQTKIATDDMMTFIVNENLNITEFSENVLSFLNIPQDKWRQIEEDNGKQLKMKELIINFEELMAQEFGLSMLPDNDYKGIANKLIQMKRFNHYTNQFDDDMLMSGLMTYCQMVFPKNDTDKVNMHVFFVLPINRHPEFDTIQPALSLSDKQISEISKYKSTPYFGTNQFNQEGLFGSVAIVQKSHENADSHHDGSTENLNQEHFSSMSSTSSASQYSIQACYAKQFLFQNKAPHSLKINIYIFIVMLLAFFIVSIFNLVIFLIKYDEISGRLWAAHYLQQRNSNLRHSLLDLKTLHMISSDVKALNRSNVIPQDLSRIQFLIDNLKQSLAQVQDYAELFQSFLLRNDQYFGAILEFDDMKFLTQDGNVYTEKVRFKHAINLLISQADSIDLNQLFIEKPPLNISDYPVKDSNKNNTTAAKTMTTIQRQLFFIFENCLFKVKELGQIQVNMLKKGSQEQTSDSIKTTNVTTFVSIAIVTLIIIIIFPMMAKTLDRQWMVIKFFNQLNPDLIQQTIDKCLLYQQKLVRTLLQQDLINYQGSEYKSLAYQQSFVDRKQSAIIDIQQVITYQPQLKKGNKSRFQKKKQSENQRRATIASEKQKHKSQNKAEPSVNDSTRYLNQNEDFEISAENDSTSQRVKSEKQQPINRAKFINFQISRMSSSQKAKLFVTICVCILFLNAQLVLYYFESSSTFGSDEEATNLVNLFFEREQCTYNAFLFFGMRAIMNSTLYIKEYDTDKHYETVQAVSRTIDNCLQIESEIYNLRKQLPHFISSISSRIEDYEGERMCNATFMHIDPQKAVSCYNTRDGILRQGFGIAQHNLITYIQQVNINFEADPKKRTSSVLNSMITNDNFQDRIDMAIYYLHVSIEQMQDLVQTSLLDFFQSSKTTFILTSAIFLTLTTVFALLLGIITFKKIKKSALEIQNILVIIPLVDLEISLRQKIEAYLSK